MTKKPPFLLFFTQQEYPPVKISLLMPLIFKVSIHKIILKATQGKSIPTKKAVKLQPSKNFFRRKKIGFSTANIQKLPQLCARRIPK